MQELAVQFKHISMEFPGVLAGYDNGAVTVDMNGTPLTFEKTEIALVRLRVEF